MNILFLSLLDINSINDSNIYTDLLKEFINDKHHVYIVSPSERRKKLKTHLIKEKNCEILKVKIGNITKVNIIEKGISTLLIESIFKKQIKKYYKNIKFDLILYATPPITFCNVIEYIKKRDNAKTYLMLKDIFPQNAVDLNMFKKSSIIYKYFRRKEIDLYKISDYIGCMSLKNKQYLLKHNKYLKPDKVEILPNSIKIRKEYSYKKLKRKQYRKKYNIPNDAKVYVYGGNLGKPQAIDFVIECLKETANIEKTYFIICGNGTEYHKLKDFIENNSINNVLLINGLPKDEYNHFLNIGDFGLIFLDNKFTIPNYPSRMLSYMEKQMPILACTDINTDIGEDITAGNFGWWCRSENSKDFYRLVNNINKINETELNIMKENELNYLKENFSSEVAYQIIIRSYNKMTSINDKE